MSDFEEPCQWLRQATPGNSHRSKAPRSPFPVMQHAGKKTSGRQTTLTAADRTKSQNPLQHLAWKYLVGRGGARQERGGRLPNAVSPRPAHGPPSRSGRNVACCTRAGRAEEGDPTPPTEGFVRSAGPWRGATQSDTREGDIDDDSITRWGPRSPAPSRPPGPRGWYMAQRKRPSDVVFQVSSFHIYISASWKKFGRRKSPRRFRRQSPTDGRFLRFGRDP